MIITGNETKTQTDPVGLTGLEQLGVFFTSQIHDLNNQMACLANAELVLEHAQVPDELRDLMDGMIHALHRLTSTVAEFGTVRRKVDLRVGKLSRPRLLKTLRDTLQDTPSWEIQCAETGLPVSRGTPYIKMAARPDDTPVQADARWLGFIVRQLITSTGLASGLVTLSIRTLPPRQYTRAGFTQADEMFLTLHFVPRDFGTQETDFAPAGGWAHELALELIRLMGASVSFGRGDLPGDILLALRMAAD